MPAVNLNWIISSLILLAGLVDDLRSRKVHNWLIISSLIFAIGSVIVLRGFSGIYLGSISFGLALALSLPLVFLKILGAGDMKLFAVFGITVDPTAVFYVLVFSLVWGGLLGLFRAILQGDGVKLLRQTAMVALKRPVNREEMHKIPYTVALFFGWLTHTSLQGGLW